MATDRSHALEAEYVVEVPYLPDKLVDALRTALNASRLPEGLARSLAFALHGYVSADVAQANRRRSAQAQEAVQRIVKAGRALQVAIDRADAAYGIRHVPRRETVSPRGRSYLIPAIWDDARAPLSHMVDELKRYLLHMSRTHPRRGRGNPHDGRRELRIRVLFACANEGIPISKASSGVAARVLRAMLEEADRRDGKPPQTRESLSGSTWARWVDEYQWVDQMARRHFPAWFQQTR